MQTYCWRSRLRSTTTRSPSFAQFRHTDRGNFHRNNVHRSNIHCSTVPRSTVSCTSIATMSADILAEDSLIMRARNSKGDCMHLYEEWANTYNKDLTETHSYVAPIVVAQTVLKFCHRPDAPILDAGCGTGLVGEALARAGATVIDGIDFSNAMLKIAEETRSYRSLEFGDLTRPIAKPDESYDIVTCCGTFAPGHVGPDPALRELVRVTTKKGVVIATVHDLVWLSGGYKNEVEKLEAEGLIKVVSAGLEDYRKGHDKARLLILEKM